MAAMSDSGLKPTVVYHNLNPSELYEKARSCAGRDAPYCTLFCDDMWRSAASTMFLEQSAGACCFIQLLTGMLHYRRWRARDDFTNTIWSRCLIVIAAVADSSIIWLCCAGAHVRAWQPHRVLRGSGDAVRCLQHQHASISGPACVPAVVLASYYLMSQPSVISAQARRA